MSVPNIKILSQVVSEKSLTEKKVNRQTNIVTEKAKTIYPLYTLYAGGINMTKWFWSFLKIHEYISLGQGMTTLCVSNSIIYINVLGLEFLMLYAKL